MELQRIAHIRTDFPAKFGIPRQSGLSLAKGEIVFEEEYRNIDALRGLEEFSYLWIIWGFSENFGKPWSPTVRPPRLGGNERRGVFATRSPFRPNPLGLSCVKLEKIEIRKEEGAVLIVSGIDMMDQTPVYDIKPYLPGIEIHTDARGGFASERENYRLEVVIPDECLLKIQEEHRDIVKEVLSQDPRPAYQNDPSRIYGMNYAGMDIRFRVNEKILEVCEVCFAERENLWNL